MLKSRMASLVHNSFKKKDGSTRYTHIKVGQRKGYFIDSSGEKMYTADQICNRIDFSVDNICVKFGGEECLFRQVIGIPMGTNCATLLADLFLYSYESEFVDSLVVATGDLVCHLIFVTGIQMT